MLRVTAGQLDALSQDSAVDHLAARGFPSATPVKGKDGQALRELNKRPAAIVTFLTGLWPRRILPFHCRALGDTMARMHLAVADFPLRRKNDLSLSGWRKLHDACAPRADEVRKGLARVLESEIAFLESHWPTGLPDGVIHADLFPDNVFFLGEELSGVIDFYFACNDAFVYDLAIMLNSWCFELDGSYNITKGQAVINAYRQQRPLSEAEIEALPVLMRGAALRFLLTRTFDWLNPDPNALVRPKDPREYSKKLRFHNKVRHARE